MYVRSAEGSRAAIAERQKKFICFVAPTFGLREGLRQRGLGLFLVLPSIPRVRRPRTSAVAVLAPPWVTLMPCLRHSLSLADGTFWAAVRERCR